MVKTESSKNKILNAARERMLKYGYRRVTMDDIVKDLKIAVVSELNAGASDEVQKSIAAAIEVYKKLGAEVIEISMPHFEYAIAAYYLIATAEASSNLARYDGVHYGHRTSEPKDYVEVYSKSRAEAFGPEVKRRIMLGTYALSSGYYDAYYLKAQKVRTRISNDFHEAFKLCDCILTPTAPTTAFRIGERIDDPLKMYLSDIFTIPANLAGIPAVSVPCGHDREGLPVGMQLMAKPFDEETLIRVAHAYERGSK